LSMSDNLDFNFKKGSLKLGVLEEIQEDVRDFLEQELRPLIFAPDLELRVLTERSEEFDHQLQTALSDEGLVCNVLPIFGNITSPNAPGPLMEDIRIQINAVETRSVNRFGVSYGFMAEQVLRVLHHFTPPSNPSIVIYPSSPSYVPLPDDHCFVAALNFKTGYCFTPHEPPITP
jgi:hypothetical protein